ncbi:hypothetical protein BT69DRAFT_1328310 [Atractiella rhizophila]|nr:hypothetical protein BT69DRAFT_1328310 [Atractiella rhizophila]
MKSWKDSLAFLVFRLWLVRAVEQNVTIDDSSASVKYSTGAWSVEVGSQYYQSTAHLTKSSGGQAVLPFNGSAVRLFGTKASTATNGSCAVDGIVKNYTAVSTTTEYQSLLCEFLNLSEDHQHIIAVTHTGKDGKAMVIDRFIVTSSESGGSNTASSTVSTALPIATMTFPKQQTTVNGGIVAGAVVSGVLLLATVATWAFWYLRRRRRKIIHNSAYYGKSSGTSMVEITSRSRGLTTPAYTQRHARRTTSSDTIFQPKPRRAPTPMNPLRFTGTSPSSDTLVNPNDRTSFAQERQHKIITKTSPTETTSSTSTPFSEDRSWSQVPPPQPSFPIEEVPLPTLPQAVGHRPSASQVSLVQSSNHSTIAHPNEFIFLVRPPTSSSEQPMRYYASDLPDNTVSAAQTWRALPETY